MHLTCIEAKKLYERDPKVKREDVEILQEWLKKQPHLPALEESQVILFLHSCYYSIEAAKNTIDAYFTRKTLYPEIFRYPGEEVVRKALSVSFKKILPKKTSQGYGIFLSKLLDERVESYDFINETLIVNLVASLYFHKNGFEEGIVCVFDFKGASLGHLTRVNLAALKHALDHLQEGMTLRIKGIHIINTPFFMDKVMALIKPLLSGKLFEAIQIHSSLDTLYKYVPQEFLPEEYCGSLPACHTMKDECINQVLDNVDFFKWHDSQMVDESKRLGKSKYGDPNFGMEGTFKKLQID